ncbi:MAG TPA: lysophospholipid acyltransferase family protein [Sphingobium sp.]
MTRLVRRESRWPRRFLAGAARLCGLRVERAGRPLGGDVFFVANHVSWLDILALGGATGCAFVSRDDVGSWPVIGWLAAQNNTILVSRSERGAVHGQIDTLRTALEQHQPVALFPEGTTGDGHVLLPFKAALFAVLLPPPRAIRVQPVFVDYGTETDAIAWTGDEPAGSNAMRVLGRRGRTRVTLRFLEPFDPGEHPDRKAIAAEVRARIEAEMRSFREPPRPV